jgi:hypothetical protein
MPVEHIGVNAVGPQTAQQAKVNRAERPCHLREKQDFTHRYPFVAGTEV